MNILGYFLLSLPFIVMFSWIIYVIGDWLEASKIVGISLLITAAVYYCIYYGLKLING